MSLFDLFAGKAENFAVRQTAKNAGLGYQRGLKDGVFASNYREKPASEIADTVTSVVAICQCTKPTTPEKKFRIVQGVDEIEIKSLIIYSCLCLRYETDLVVDRKIEEWMGWIRIIDQELISHEVPSELRYGFGVSNQDIAILDFIRLWPKYFV